MSFLILTTGNGLSISWMDRHLLNYFPPGTPGNPLPRAAISSTCCHKFRTLDFLDRRLNLTLEEILSKFVLHSLTQHTCPGETVAFSLVLSISQVQEKPVSSEGNIAAGGAFTIWDNNHNEQIWRQVP